MTIGRHYAAICRAERRRQAWVVCRLCLEFIALAAISVAAFWAAWSATAPMRLEAP